MIRLRDKDIEKLAIILDLPKFAIEKMAAMNLVHEGIAVDTLIAYDWKRLKKNKRYRVRQIIQALANEYQVSKTKVEAAMYNKRKCIYSCQQCGKRITKAASVKNNGLCEECVVKSIVI